MNVRLHKNATTTPAQRAYIQSSRMEVAALAAELGVTEDTIRRWKSRDSVEDRPHTPHRLQTTLTPAQEAVVKLRKTLWLPLDDLLQVTREFIFDAASRSGLQRFLAAWSLQAPPRAEAGRHAQAVQGLQPRVYPHRCEVSAARMADEERRRYPRRGHRPGHPLGVRADQGRRPARRASSSPRWPRLAPCASRRCSPKTSAASFGEATMARSLPIACLARSTEAAATMSSTSFARRGAEHRLRRLDARKPTAWSSLKGRIAEVLATHHFKNAEDLETTLLRYVWLYNHHLPQKAIGHIPPIEAMKTKFRRRLTLAKPMLSRVSGGRSQSEASA
jgi:transposase-like protein